MTPLTHPNEYAVMVFGASVSPGTVTFTGHDREWTWDVETAKGQKGASSKLAGDTIGQPQATFYLASVEDQIAWPAFQRVLEASLVGPTAQPVYHPDLAANRYTELAVANIGGILRDSNGGATVVVKFIEYRPPKPAPSKPATGGGGGGGGGGGSRDGGSGYDPNAARKEQLEELLDEARNA